jgi:hypothetical protein
MNECVKDAEASVKYTVVSLNQFVDNVLVLDSSFFVFSCQTLPLL